MSNVYYVTCFEAGWDNVVGIFDPQLVTFERLLEAFPEDQYYINEVSVETSIEGHPN